MLIYSSCVVGTVNKSTVDVYPMSYRVEFNDVGKNSSMSTPLTINIVDDPLVETRESFLCIAFQPRDMPGVRLENPRTLEITIVDNDSQCWMYYPNPITCAVAFRHAPCFHSVPISWVLSISCTRIHVHTPTYMYHMHVHTCMCTPANMHTHMIMHYYLYLVIPLYLYIL